MKRAFNPTIRQCPTQRLANEMTFRVVNDEGRTITTGTTFSKFSRANQMTATEIQELRSIKIGEWKSLSFIGNDYMLIQRLS